MPQTQMKIEKEIDVLNLVQRSLETKTRTFTGQIVMAMEDAFRHEMFLQSEKHRVDENTVSIPNAEWERQNAMRFAVINAEKEYNYYAIGKSEATRGIFSEDLEGSLGFQSYLIENVFKGDTTFGLKYLKEQGYKINQESVKKLIASLQTLIEE